VVVGFDNVAIGSSRYRLIAFAQHRGASTRRGHYVAYVRTEGDRWYLFNDSAKPKLLTTIEVTVQAVRSYYYIY
jgi:uncharacterized UBP type Zn finger protein